MLDPLLEIIMIIIGGVVYTVKKSWDNFIEKNIFSKNVLQMSIFLNIGELFADIGKNTHLKKNEKKKIFPKKSHDFFPVYYLLSVRHGVNTVLTEGLRDIPLKIVK